MAIIRLLEIQNFRGIKNLRWQPTKGINCLVGPGDSGKSTILDAIDLCLGARRNVCITDADFHRLNVNEPIKITITLGALDNTLKNIDSYGLYLQGFDSSTGTTSSEPEATLETVLRLQLMVESDLEPQWMLASARATAQGQSRNLNWPDRVRLAPTRLGSVADYNLSWQRGSLLTKLSEERANAAIVLAQAVRNVRNTFSSEANTQLAQTLDLVTETAHSLGVPVGAGARAMLDATSVSFSGGAVALHDEYNVPLNALGLGSSRLLIAGLQRRVAAQASIVLIDELEQGLEPHRIIRLLDALGAKEPQPPLQVFMTTHSPVAVRELTGNQLFILRTKDGAHEARKAGTADDIQGTIRRFPDAILAHSVLVCEGASEIGLMRGLDQHRMTQRLSSIAALGIALVDGGGNEVFNRARALQALGYRTSVLRDSDVIPTPELERDFMNDGGTVFAWRAGRSLEDELFLSLTNGDVGKLLELAITLKEESIVNEHIKTASNNTKTLDDIRSELLTGCVSVESRHLLGKASRHREAKRSWFKSIRAMELASRDIMGPNLDNADLEFKSIITSIFEWITNARS